MWRSRKDNLKRRMLSGILACLLVATSLTNTVGVISAFAAQGTDAPRVSYKYDDLKNDRGDLDKLVQINVQAENESFLPGSEMVLKVYVQNLSDQYLTGGSLKWNGKGLEEAGFLDEEEEDVFNGPGWDSGDSAGSDATGGQDGGLMEELGSFGVTGLRKSVALRVDDTNPADGTDGEEGQAPEEKPETIGGMDFTEITEIQDSDEDDSDEPETDDEGKRIKGIELAPGEVYETRFYGTVEDLDSIVTRKVTFEFLAGVDGNDQKLAQDKTEFTYNTGMALVLPVEFEDGPALMTNELNTLYIRTRFEDEKILDEYTWDVTDGDEDEATPADAQRHEITVATMSNGDGDSSEGTTPANMKYSIVTYGAKLLGIEAWRDEDKSDWGEVATGVSFRVADGTEPGVYFGQVTTSIRRDGKSYKTTQGFHFFVLGDGQIVLKGNVNGAEIQVKGDRESFPEGDMLSLKVTEVPEEKMGLVQEAMAQKADELGVSVDKMMAVDIKVIADGTEQELRGDVQVTFSNLKMESVDGSLDSDDTADAADSAEADDAAEAEEFEEISNHSVFGLRKAAAQNDRAEEQAVEENPAADDLAAETESQDENGEKEDSSLAVWHFNEDQGSIDEMDSETNDDGDVVMTTEHFSIFILVEVENASGIINVRIQHVTYLERFKIENGTVVEIDHPRDAATHNKLRPGEVFLTLATEEKLTGIYSSEVIQLENGLKISPEKLSKIDLQNKEVETDVEKNYDIAEIWIKKGTINNNDPEVNGPKDNGPLKDSEADKSERAAWVIWTKRKDENGDFLVNEKGEFIWDNIGKETSDIILDTDSIVRFLYEEQEHTFPQDVYFYDYDVTDGVQGNNINTEKKGINSNLSSTPALAVGQEGNKIMHGHADDKLSGKLINRANSDKSVTENIVELDLVDGLPSFQYDGKKIDEPGLFQSGTGSTIIEGYKLEFNKSGDTYTLEKVYDESNNVVLEKLSQLPYLKAKWTSAGDGSAGYVYSNNFWPLDTVLEKEKYSSSIKDPLMGGGKDYYVENYGAYLNMGNDDYDLDKVGVYKDESKRQQQRKKIQNYNEDGHNQFFGMVFQLKFTLGDYVGPLNYYFRGDDDFWLYLDGKKIVDLGGIHQATGKSIDLWEVLKERNQDKDKTKEHVLKFFFNERGATGSCCYMQFTLPHVTADLPPFNIEHVSKSVIKNWDDDNNAGGKRPNANAEIKVQLWQENSSTGEKKAYNKPAILTMAKGWKETWLHLPKYVLDDEGKPLEDENGNKYEYEYTVEEITEVADYVPSYNQEGGTVNGEHFDFVITNTYHETTNVTVKKEWKGEIKDSNNNPTMRPKSIEVQLYQNGDPYKDTDGNEVKVLLPTNPNEWKKDEWEYTWSNLRKYDPNGNEYVYTVQEIGGDWLKSDSNSLKGWYVSEVDGTIITNTYIPEYTERTVTKYWDDNDNKFGLRPQSISLQLKRGSEEATELNDYTVDIEEPKTLTFGSNNSGTCKWEGLDKYYFVRDQKNGDKVVRKEYKYLPFEVSYNPNTQPYYRPIYSSVNGTDLSITLTNKLQTAKFRVAKRIDNIDTELDKSDLREDEFIVEVKNADAKPEFNTGLVLKHAGDSDEAVGVNAKKRVSGYIEVPVTNEGVLYNITEIVPKEYQLNDKYEPSKSYLTIIKNEIGGEKVAFINGKSQVMIKPGSTDTIVIVHNKFDHSDYFHGKASVTNFFKGDPSSVPDMARLVVPMGAFMAEENGKEWERKYQDDERLM